MDATIVQGPQKRYYRQRAHVNPIADHILDHPLSPNLVDWTTFYPHYDGHKVTALDVGCGYGGLLIALAPMLDSKELALGLEIRSKVSAYVQERVIALRKTKPETFNNVWCIRTNAMRYIPNYIHRGQLTRIFFLFPDPHFKKTKHKWRIINRALLAEYAYVCAVDAIVYIATDVKDLFEWMVAHFDDHELFKELNNDELDSDPVVDLIRNSTEEGKKVERNKGDKFVSAFRRIQLP
ncbi:hypothetical protein GZH46_01854, partial [Fragariocoptes setiger]